MPLSSIIRSDRPGGLARDLPSDVHSSVNHIRREVWWDIAGCGRPRDDATGRACSPAGSREIPRADFQGGGRQAARDSDHQRGEGRGNLDLRNRGRGCNIVRHFLDVASGLHRSEYQQTHSGSSAGVAVPPGLGTRGAPVAGRTQGVSLSRHHPVRRRPRLALRATRGRLRSMAPLGGGCPGGR